MSRAHVYVSAGKRYGKMNNPDFLNVDVIAGGTQGNSKIIPFSDKGDKVLAVVDMTNGTNLDSTDWNFSGNTNIVYSGVTDLTLTNLQVIWSRLS